MMHNNRWRSALIYAHNSAQISISGGTYRKRKAVKQAARWMLGYLLGNRQANHITLVIRLTDKYKNSNYYGSILWEDRNIKPREFDMELCNHLNDRMLYKTLAHESIHIKQYVVGDLKDIARSADYCKWKNELVQSEGLGKIPYRSLPWEMEAFAYQSIILKEWQKTHGYKFRRSTGELYDAN
jgi:hypothetical protein